MPEILVKVSGPGGHVCDMALDAEATAGEAKDAIAAAQGIPFEAQRLFLGTEELQEGSCLLASSAGAAPAIELLLLRRTPEQVGWLQELKDNANIWELPNWMGGLPDAAWADREVCLAAGLQNPDAFGAAAQELRTDRAFCFAAVSQDWKALQYVGEDFRGDRELVLKAVSQAGGAIQFASPDLQADFELVRLAVAQDACSLRFASEELRTDGRLTQPAGEGGC